MVIWVNSGHVLRSTPAAAPMTQSKAYVDFAADCHRMYNNQAIRRNGDVHDAAAYRISMVPMGSGGIAFSIPPGGFRFLSPRRKEQRDCIGLHGNVHYSIQLGAVFRWLPQSFAFGKIQLPPGGSLLHSDAAVLCRNAYEDSFRHPPRRMPPPSGREALCIPTQLVCTGHSVR